MKQSMHAIFPAIVILLGAVGCLFAQTAPGDSLIGEYALVMTQFSYVETPVLDANAAYYLKVTGNFGCGHYWSWLDAAYCWGICNPPCRALDCGGGNSWAWGWNNDLGHRPTPDQYNPDHVYYYPFIGRGSLESFSYSDPGSYWDNSGGLTIQVWRQGISVAVPNGGEQWQTGSLDTVRWTSSNLEGNIRIELNRQYPGGSWEILVASTPSDGEELVQVTGPASTTCRIRVSSVDDTTVFDISDADFSIMCSPTELPFIDTFDSPDLDSCWFWIREDTSHWSLTERPGWMRIEPTGETYEAINNASNILLRSLPNSNFVVETRISQIGNGNGAALVVYDDDENFVDLLYYEWGERRIRSHSETNGSIVWSEPNISAHDWQSCYSRIRKLGNQYSMSVSSDGGGWTEFATWQRDFVSNGHVSVGLLGYHHHLASPDIADFDYFRVDPLPGTNVCGDVSGVWDSTGSPYYVTCDVTVPAGQTLEIRPGVQVLFTGHYKFNVFGNLQAIGTEEDSIVFTRAFPTEESRWWGIRLYNASDTSRMSFCLVEYGRAEGTPPDEAGGGICAYISRVVLSHCRISHNSAAGGGGGLHCDTYAPYISDCVVSENTASLGGGVEIWHASPVVQRCLIQNNTATSAGGGVRWAQSSPRLDNCTISGNSAPSGGGIWSEGGTFWGEGTVINTIVSSCNGGGVVFNQATQSTFCYSDVFGNSGGDFVNGGQGPAGIGQMDTTNANGDSCDQYNNISLDPMFVDTANGDFHLQAGSPCIDAGDPNSPLDSDSTRADMGAYPYFHPCLMIDPDALEYGLLDLGTDSTTQIVLRNPTSQPIPVTDVFCTLPAFSVDTVGLGGQVSPFAAYYLSVTFAPSAAGVFTDTLVIAVQQPCDTLIRIPLHGAADVILPRVDSLVIQRGPMNGIQLDWAAVTHSISGQPVQDVLYAIYGSTSCEGPFVPFAYSTTNSYVHPYILNGQAMYFYQVTADVGSSRGQSEQR